VRILSGIILVLSLFVSAGSAVDLPDQQNTVNDYANVIDQTTVQTIRTLSAEIYKSKGVNLKIAIVMTTAPDDPYVFGRALYAKWDMGRTDRGTDRGVLMLITVFERKARLIVGEDIDFVLPAATREKVEWTVLSGMTRGDFSKGVLLGGVALSDLLLKDWPKPDVPVEGQIDWADAFRKILALFAVSLMLTYVVGGGMPMLAAIMIGGIFGYVSLSLVGMIIGGSLGFFLSLGKHSQ
jgi:uncharacterized membrane protein YgcG